MAKKLALPYKIVIDTDAVMPVVDSIGTHELISGAKKDIERALMQVIEAKHERA